jgi:histidine triad (HIT) family protein
LDQCLFCKIASGAVQADRVYEDDEVLAFRDITPLAPTHVLVIPKRHIATLNDLDELSAPLVGRMFLAAREAALRDGIGERGYRTVMNCNAEAGQVIFHIHLHVIGGKPLGWPPG